jgi:hypothetical protein
LHDVTGRRLLERLLTGTTNSTIRRLAVRAARASPCGYAIADVQAGKQAREIPGENRILTTPGLLVVAIRCGMMSVHEAGRHKVTLESRRFSMSVVSFRDVI